MGPLVPKLQGILQLISHRSLLFSEHQHLHELIAPLTTVCTVANAVEHLEAHGTYDPHISLALKHIGENIPEEWTLDNMEAQATYLITFKPQFELFCVGLKGSPEIPELPPGSQTETVSLCSPAMEDRILEYLIANPRDIAGCTTHLDGPSTNEVRRIWRTFVVTCNAGISATSARAKLDLYTDLHGKNWEKNKELLHEWAAKEVQETRSPNLVALASGLSDHHKLAVNSDHMSKLVDKYECFVQTGMGCVEHRPHGKKRPRTLRHGS